MAVTVTYTHPVAGTTAPTASQARNVNSVIATVIATADADTTATITHNLGISAADLAKGFPQVAIEPILAAGQTSVWFVSARAANTVTLTKGTGAGSGNAGAQIYARVMRPNTLVQ